MNRIVVSIGAVALVALTLWAFSPQQAVEGVAGIRVDPTDAYNPVAAGESLPAGFRQLLPRDAITPVYEPEFVSGERVAWPGDAHVIGVTAGNVAKAYPVSFLNRREMVIDEINGDPILVTW